MLGLNRWDTTTPDSLAVDIARGEALGYSHALLGTNSLRLWDIYVLLALAARQTRSIRLAPFVDNPVMRHPATLAGSIATVDELSAGRADLVLGVADIAVRWAGQPPATVSRLEWATALTRRLLAGEPVDPGAAVPVRLEHARPVPVWIAAGGPRTLRMAGRVADGVYLRVGRADANLRAAVAAVHAGAKEAGRTPPRSGSAWSCIRSRRAPDARLRPSPDAWPRASTSIRLCSSIARRCAGTAARYGNSASGCGRTFTTRRTWSPRASW